MKTLEEIAEAEFNKRVDEEGQDKNWVGYGKGADGITKKKWIELYIRTVNSDFVKEQILIENIELLNKLDTILQIKIERLKEMASQSDIENFNYLNSKISGVKLAQEEIRRDIQKFEILL